MLRPSALRARKRNAPRPAWKVALSFLQWLRGRPCACEGRNPECSGVIQAAHVDYAAKGTPDAKGGSTKVADRWSIPLSAACHHLQHSKGWPWFEKNILRRSAAAMSQAYWRAWPGKGKWEAQNDG